MDPYKSIVMSEALNESYEEKEKVKNICEEIRNSRDFLQEESPEMKQVRQIYNERRYNDYINNQEKFYHDQITHNLVEGSYYMIEDLIKKYGLQNDSFFLEISLLLGFAVITEDSIELVTQNLNKVIYRLIQFSIERKDPYYFNVIHDGIKNTKLPFLSIFSSYFDK